MEWFVPIKNDAPALQLAYQRLELNKKPATKAKMEALASIRAQWRCLVDYVVTFFKEQLEQLSTPIPQVKPALVYSKGIIPK